MTGYIFGSGGGSGVDVSDTTLLQNEALPGKYFYLANGQKVQGTMPVKEATIATPSTKEQILVPAGTYAKGDQKIAGAEIVKFETSGDIYFSDGDYSSSKMTIPTGNITRLINGTIMYRYAQINNLDTSRVYIYGILLNNISSDGNISLYSIGYDNRYGWRMYLDYYLNVSIYIFDNKLEISPSLSQDARFFDDESAYYQYTLFGN